MDAKSIMGYADHSPFRNNPYLDIQTPEGLITMENTSIDLLGIPNVGKPRIMKKGKKSYQFPGATQVREVPIAQDGGLPGRTPYSREAGDQMYRDYLNFYLNPNPKVTSKDDGFDAYNLELSQTMPKSKYTIQGWERERLIDGKPSGMKEMYDEKPDKPASDRWTPFQFVTRENEAANNEIPQMMDLIRSRGMVQKDKDGTFKRPSKAYQFNGNPYQMGGMTDELISYLFDDNDEEEAAVQEAPIQIEEDDKSLSLQKTERLIRQREQDELAMGQVGNDNPYRRNTLDDNFGFEDDLPDVEYSSPNTYTGQIHKGFRSFATPEEGWSALKNQLELYKTGRTRNPVGPNSTLLEAMSVYAPAADRNNPVAYANRIASRLGISPQTRIANIDTERWAREIAAVEGNKKGNNPGNLRPH